MSGYLQNDQQGDQLRRMMLAVGLSLLVMVLYTTVFAPRRPVPPSGAEGSSEGSAEVVVAPEGSGAAIAAPSAVPGVVALPAQTLVTNELRLGFTNAGARLDTVDITSPEQYADHATVGGAFPSDVSSARGLTLDIGGLADLGDAALYEFVEAESQRAAGGEDYSTLVYRWTAPDGLIVVTRTYTVSEAFGVDLRVTVANRSDRERRFDGLALGIAGLPPAERAAPMQPPLAVTAICEGEYGHESKNIRKLREERTFVGPTTFAALAEHYFMMALLPTSVPEGVSQGCSFAPGANGASWARVTLGEFGVPAAGETSFTWRVYAGPKDVRYLELHNPDLRNTLNFGWFSFIAWPIRWLLLFFQQWVVNWGIAIIVLTMTVKAVLFPVTQRAFRSMERLRAIQPQLTAIQKKHENDRMKLAEEQMKLFKESGTSPFGGCMPMLLQMPIWIALYRTISGSVELYRAPFALWIHDLSERDPYFVMPLALGVTMYIQQVMTPQTNDNPQMKTVMKIMPIMFTAMMLFLPSGLVLYIFVNNILSIAQQMVIRRQMGIQPPTPSNSTR